MALMKKLIILIFVSLTFFSFQLLNKKYKLNYEPSGKIISFENNEFLMYSDTQSVFKILNEYDKKEYRDDIKNMILQRLRRNNNDTLHFQGSLIPIESKLGLISNKKWYTDYVILNLLKMNRIMIIDNHGKKVKKIKTKRIKTKGKGAFKEAFRVRRAFINIDTNEEIISEFIKGKTITPKF